MYEAESALFHNTKYFILSSMTNSAQPAASAQKRSLVHSDRLLGEPIAHCLDGLPLAQRSVFVLREMEGVETEEVCKILEVTITNMGVLMHRARNRLRECLEGRGWGRTE